MYRIRRRAALLAAVWLAVGSDAPEAQNSVDPAARIAELTQQARVATERGDLTRADSLLRDALPIAERAGNALGEASVLRALGRLNEARGRQQEALDQFQ